MSLTLHYHPLSSFCWKVLIALYENGTPFKGEVLNLGDRDSCAEFFRLWPMGKMPLLRDERRDRTVPETSIIIEYLDQHYPGAQRFLPADEERRLDTRLWDRFFDLYLQVPMQKIVADRLRPEGRRDAHGVDDAFGSLKTAYDVLERHMATRTWAIGEEFTMADCAAWPGLFYGECVSPFTKTHPNIASYFERLARRPSVDRVVAEARPFFQYFPIKGAIPARFL